MSVEQLREVIKLGVEMRAAQKQYFRTRSPVNLEASKAKERAFDLAAALALETQTDLLGAKP
jgi:hypothetical protein